MITRGKLFMSVFAAIARPLDLTKIQLKDSGHKTVQFTFADTNSCIVFVFLSPECPLSQQYTLALNALAKQYENWNLKFYGVIPGRMYDLPAINDFRKQYHITFPLLLDADLKVTKLLNATITPQAVVVKANEIAYSGAIDNGYVSLGKKKAVTNVFYLQDAITAIQNKQEVVIKKTNAIGCLIENKNDPGKK
jgi:peroxiredoxin